MFSLHNPISSSTNSLLPFLIALGLMAAVLFTACNHEPNVTEVDYPGTEGGKVYFLTQSNGANTDSADLFGTLDLVDGCLQIAHEATDGAEPSNIVWPVGFGIAIDDESILILDDDDRVVTRVGEQTLLGGSGGADNFERLGGCEGSFWYAGATVRSGDDVPARYRESCT